MYWLDNITPAIIDNLWQAAIGYLCLYAGRSSQKTKPGTTYVAGMGLQLLLFLAFTGRIVSPHKPVNTNYLSTDNIIFYNINYLLSFTYILLLIINSIRSIWREQKNKYLLAAQPIPVAPTLSLHFEQLKRKVGIRRSIRLLFHGQQRGPFTKGFLKPTIVLPLSAVTGLTSEQIEAVLLHELWHIKRYDYLFLLLQIFLEKVFYFNPFFLLISKATHEDRELSCDLHAINTNNYKSSDYITSLLFFSQTETTISPVVTGLNATGKQKSEFYNRAAYLLENRKNRRYEGKLWMHLFAVVAFCFSFVRFTADRSATLSRIQENPIAHSAVVVQKDNPAEPSGQPILTSLPLLATAHPKKTAINKRKNSQVDVNKQINNKNNTQKNNNILPKNIPEKHVMADMAINQTNTGMDRLADYLEPSIATDADRPWKLVPVAAPQGAKAFMAHFNHTEDADIALNALVRRIQEHFPIQATTYQYAAYIAENSVHEENTTLLQSNDYRFLLVKGSDHIKLLIIPNTGS